MAAKAFVFLLMANLAQSNLNGCKCDPSLIDKISKFYNENSPYKPFSEFIHDVQQVNFSDTTETYLDHSTSCAFVNYLSHDSIKFSLFSENGESTTATQNMKEYTPGKVTRYGWDGEISYTFIIFANCSGLLWYKCTENATCTETNAAFLRISRQDPCDPAPAETALRIAKSLGIILNQHYTCSSQNCSC